MKTRNKRRETNAFHCNARGRCCLSLAVWSMFGFMVMIHLHYTIYQSGDKETPLRLHRLTIARELEEIEEEEFHVPPPRGRRSPRAVLRRGPPKPRTAIDEFLDEDSVLRPSFFPSYVIDPRLDGVDKMYFYPGRQWLDTDGNPIQAHGGGILHVESTGTFYWYGENKDGPTYPSEEQGIARVDIIGVNCYSSKDLWAWKNEGVVLPAEANQTHDLHKSNVLERPKVIYNDKTTQYVMWMHIDDSNYTKASAGVAISNNPTGPFEYLYSIRPHGCESRDMTIFKDDDGKAYLVYSSNDNRELHIGPLTDDYLNVTDTMRRVLVGQHREAPSLFKHQGMYYMITSDCTGWAPNEALAHTAESIMGTWKVLGNPCVGGNKIFRSTTFFSQNTFILPLPGLPGFFVFMADRWNHGDLRNSRYVWLPLSASAVFDENLDYNFGLTMRSRVLIYWHRRWRLPLDWRSA